MSGLFKESCRSRMLWLGIYVGSLCRGGKKRGYWARGIIISCDPQESKAGKPLVKVQQVLAQLLHCGISYLNSQEKRILACFSNVNATINTSYGIFQASFKEAVIFPQARACHGAYIT